MDEMGNEMETSFMKKTWVFFDQPFSTAKRHKKERNYGD